MRPRRHSDLTDTRDPRGRPPATPWGGTPEGLQAVPPGRALAVCTSLGILAVRLVRQSADNGRTVPSPPPRSGTCSHILLSVTVRELGISRLTVIGVRARCGRLRRAFAESPYRHLMLWSSTFSRPNPMQSPFSANPMQSTDPSTDRSPGHPSTAAANRPEVELVAKKVNFLSHLTPRSADDLPGPVGC